jgi:glycerophosphoryl diester phosphodiesterase
MLANKSLEIPGIPKPYVMAHRGARIGYPENTLAAFQYAFDSGADLLETDLQITADGHFVCFHDDTLERTTDGHGAVASLALSEVKRYCADCGMPGFSDQRVPTLAELAAISPDSVYLMLELKTDSFLEAETCQRLVDELDQLGIRGRTGVLSFSLARIQAVKSIAPDIPIGWITLKQPMPRQAVELQGPLWPWLFLNPLYVALAHRRGMAVCPLDPAPDARLWWYRFIGCDAVLTDEPRRTLAKLGRGADSSTPQV